jgi:hypothetical protein
MAVFESQLMLPKAPPLSVQSVLISQEGLRIMQSPMVSHVSAGMVSKEYVVGSPVLQLLSNIVLNIGNLTSKVATQASLSGVTDFENDFLLSHDFQIVMNSGSTINASPSMAMAGVATLSPACYMTPGVSMQRDIQISSMITARQSRTKIVAQGNLVRRYE